MWICKCRCGNRKILATDYLTSKGYRSCGCLRNDLTRKRSMTHGATVGRHPTKEYRAWTHMKGRCYNPTDQRYASCGGRGIKMCAAWRKDFVAFLKDMGRAPPNGVLKRLDIDEDYGPQNCFWKPPSQSARHHQKRRGSGARSRARMRLHSNAKSLPRTSQGSQRHRNSL
jgi:hypothetical protein